MHSASSRPNALASPNEVEGLKAFEREYRGRLRSFLEGQLTQLTSRGSDDTPLAPAASPNAARRDACVRGQPRWRERRPDRPVSVRTTQSSPPGRPAPRRRTAPPAPARVAALWAGSSMRKSARARTTATCSRSSNQTPPPARRRGSLGCRLAGSGERRGGVGRAVEPEREAEVLDHLRRQRGRPGLGRRPAARPRPTRAPRRRASARASGRRRSRSGRCCATAAARGR